MKYKRKTHKHTVTDLLQLVPILKKFSNNCAFTNFVHHFGIIILILILFNFLFSFFVAVVLCVKSQH